MQLEGSKDLELGRTGRARIAKPGKTSLRRGASTRNQVPLGPSRLRAFLLHFSCGETRQLRKETRGLDRSGRRWILRASSAGPLFSEGSPPVPQAALDSFSRVEPGERAK